MQKIDTHMHCFRIRPLAPHTGESTYFMTPEEVLAKWDAYGIKSGILLPVVSPEYMGPTQTNAEVLALVREYPERFSWFCNIDPRACGNSPNSDFSSLLRTCKDQGALGLGEITANLPFDDPLMKNLFSHCEQNGMPVLFHIAPQQGGCYGLVDDVGLPGLENALQTFPSLVFIAHSQPFWAEIAQGVTPQNRNQYPKGLVKPGRVVELMRHYSNLYADLSANSGFNALKRDEEFALTFLEEFSDRLFFATDLCAREEDIGLSFWLDAMHEKGRLKGEVYRKICWENAEQILFKK